MYTTALTNTSNIRKSTKRQHKLISYGCYNGLCQAFYCLNLHCLPLFIFFLPTSIQTAIGKGQKD